MLVIMFDRHSGSNIKEARSFFFCFYFLLSSGDNNLLSELANLVLTYAADQRCSCHCQIIVIKDGAHPFVRAVVQLLLLASLERAIGRLRDLNNWKDILLSRRLLMVRCF